MNRKVLIVSTASLVLASAPAVLRAATGPELDDDALDYPSRPLHLIVSSPAGTAVDALARLVGSRLATALGQPVTVENRPGAAGDTAVQAVARAAPDGYTLAIAGAAVTINPSLPGTRAVEPVRALAPVIQLATQPILVVAHPSLPARTPSEIVALARRTPGKLAYSTAGAGTPAHIAAALFASQSNITLLHVPYAGSGQPLSDVLSGDVPLSFTLLAEAQPFLHAGRLRAIAVTSERRAAALPGVSTVAESGYPGFDVVSWHGIVAPAGTPRPIVARLYFEFSVMLREPAVVAQLSALGMEPAPATPHAFGERIAAETARWKQLIDRTGIRVDR